MVWSVEVSRPGTYSVRLHGACPDHLAGNTFVLRAAQSYLTGKVSGTGDGQTYREAPVGEITLQAGPQRISFEPLGKLLGSLLNLRSVKLVPVTRD